MTKEVINVDALAAKVFSDFMRWGGVGSTIDFNGLMQLIDGLEKKGYVIVIDYETTYLHYPKSEKNKKIQQFDSISKIKGVYGACLAAVKHYYHY